MLDDEESYRRYKQYRNNRYRYQQEQITFPITVIIAMMIFFKYWYIILSVAAIVLGIIIYRAICSSETFTACRLGMLSI